MHGVVFSGERFARGRAIMSRMIVSSTPVPPVSKTAHWNVWARFVLLNFGLLFYGIALAAMIRANVGLAPWDAFHVGMARVIPHLTIGQASIAIGFVLQAVAWAWLGMRPGIGSVFNMVLLGVYIDVFLRKIPLPQSAFGAWLMFIGGIFVVGIATGTYIASGFGAGPRDSMVLGLQKKWGWPVKNLRTAIEMTALFGGFLMGAKIGWGTLAYALLIGPSMSVGFTLYGLRR